MSKTANYNEYSIKQTDLPGILKREFGLSERFSVGLVESIRLPTDESSFVKEKGIEATKHEAAWVEELKDAEGDSIHMSSRYARITKGEEFDILVIRNTADAVRDNDQYNIQGWKNPK